jgi:nucleoid-associated protein YgaU
MGNATKVALVALLILLVVVVARFVREDSTPEKDVADGGPASAKNLPGKVPARNSQDPARGASGTSVVGKGDLATRGRQAATIPAVARNPAPAAPAPAVASPAGAAGATALRSGGPDGTGARTVFSPIDPSTTGVSTAPGSTPGADAGAVQPRTVATAPLPAPNPLGSLDGPPGGSTVRRLEGALPDAKSREGHPTDPARPSHDPAPAVLVQTRLGEPHDPARNPQDPGPATTPGSGRPTDPTPFRALAESGREAQGLGVRGSHDPARDSVRPAPGVAREPTRPERSSGTDATETFHDARGYPKTHEVVKGDSFWGLADRHYGDGRLAAFLEKENGGKKLRPGMKVTIPAPPGDYRPPARVATAPGTSRDPAPARPAAPGTPTIPPRGDRDYVVQKGDTLSLIARKFYGDPAKFHLLEEANPDLKYQMLQAGARIKVPRKE